MADACLPVSEFITPANINQYEKTAYIVVLHYNPAVQYFATSVVLPTFSLGTIPVPTAGLTIKTPGNNITVDQLSIEFIVDEDLHNYFQILDWLFKAGSKNGPEDWLQLKEERNADSIEPRTNVTFDGGAIDISVITLDNKKSPRTQLFFTDCFPVSIQGNELRQNEEDPQPMTIQTSFEVNDFRARNLVTGHAIG